MQPTLDRENLAGWTLTHDGKRIRKDWKVKNFLAGLDFFNRVAQLAESMNHHPDIHLENYREAWIEIWTHSAGGLTDNDFELARRIDALPAKPE
jgi:4a-hydroxytetrahydrobiopterin dehydratase